MSKGIKLTNSISSNGLKKKFIYILLDKIFNIILKIKNSGHIHGTVLVHLLV